MAAKDDLDNMPLDHISRQLHHIIIPPRNFDHDDYASPAPSEYDDTEGDGSWGFNDGLDRDELLLEFALGRPWNQDDTRMILTRIYELQNEDREGDDVIVDHVLTDYQREAIMHRVVREYLENQTVLLGPGWYDNNVDDLYWEINIIVQNRELSMEEYGGEVGPEIMWVHDDDDYGPRLMIYGGGGLSKETIREHLRTRICGDDVVGEEKMCTICQDQLYQGTTTLGMLKCGHEYHVDCIQPWLLQTNVCPLCRAKALDVDS